MPPQGNIQSLGREVEFKINGKPYKATSDLAADTSLNWFIREHAHLPGTKFMCLEGGCGTCIVMVEYVHPRTQKKIQYAANSCLVPIFVCHGWEITTVEGVGNQAKGYNKVQTRLAAANGTQCGYCSPGMVMNMYSLLQRNPKITMKEVENSFGGNICRCTGYRPILDAFKSLASDAPNDLVKKLADIEDAAICPKTGKACSGPCGKCGDSKLPVQSLKFELQGGGEWYRPVTKKEIFEIIDMIGNKSYRLVAGNTGQGVFRITHPPDVYIDINGIPELHGHGEPTANGLVLGANIDLTEAMELFYKLAKEKPNQYAYLKTLADHIDLIANVPVRNIGTFGGNIFMKHAVHGFPSDIFLFLEMVGTQLGIEDVSGVEMKVGLMEFLSTPMEKRLITQIYLPALDNSVYFTRSYKIMPRAQNAHAYVNAAFMIKADKKDKFRILEKPTILFGGIKENFLHATKTEEFLNGKRIMDERVLQDTLKVLEGELHPEHEPPDASPEFRRGLAESLLYKFVLSLSPETVNSKYSSGGSLLERPVSSGKQDFETDKSIWPLNKPVPKMEAVIQCAGEAEYTNDIPQYPNQVWGALVLSTKAAAVVTHIDPSEALKMPGVVAFFSAKDIPGENNYMPRSPLFVVGPEPVFVPLNAKTNYAGEAVGVVLADTHAIALKAAQKVKVTYGKSDKFYLDQRHVIKDNVADRIKEHSRISPKTTKSNVKYKIQGHWDLKSQYHYTMEPQSCVAVPIEDCIEVYPTSQCPSWVQEVVSMVLNIPENNVNLKVRRIGGGYGAKISRTNHIGAVTALAAKLLNRPVRIVLQMETNMEWAGKRFPYVADYDVGVDENGAIQNLQTRIYQDDGFVGNESAVVFTLHHFENCYDPSTWTVIGYGVKTDQAGNTWCRAPGSTEAISMIETIMEHIANVTGKDPIAVRLANLDPNDKNIPALIDDIKKSSDYDKRLKEVERFNQANRWKKRGISLIPMTYPFFYFGNFYAMVSIFGQDGSVAISHGCVEMGQGINTKAAQVAAHILGIEYEQVTVKQTDTFISPNNFPTGASLGSECVAYSVKKCCEELNKRLAPIKEKLGAKATWKDIINKAYDEAVNLNYTYMFTNKDDVKPYTIYGVAVSEVELDVLTGQFHTKRVDLIEDAGISMSPEVDIGQIEGAFVMGMGFFTCEELVYESETGRLLTNRTWNYKPPGAKDIPIDFRISLRKNAPNPVGVLRSKATGEPPFCLSNSVMFALRNALESARKDTGKQELWFDLEPPLTGERLWMGTLNKKDMFKLY